MLKDLRLDNLFPYLMSTKFISILTHCVEIRPRNTNDGRFEALIKFPRNTVRISLNHKACCEETVRKQLSRAWLQETGVSAPVWTCSNFRERNKIRHIFSLSYLSFFLRFLATFIGGGACHEVGTLRSFLYHVGLWWWAPLVCLAISLLLVLEFFSPIPHTVPSKSCQALRPPLSRTERKFTSWLQVATQGESQWPLQIMCMIPGGWHFSVLSGFIPCSVSAAYGWWINGFPMWTRALSPRYPWV